jgi:hypothetical protein
MEVRPPDILTIGIEVTFTFNIEPGKDDNIAAPSILTRK